MKFLLALVITLSGCASTPLRKNTEEYQHDLLSLIQSDDEAGLKKYFEANATCIKPDAIFGCKNADKVGLSLMRDVPGTSNEILTIDDIVAAASRSKINLEKLLKNCEQQGLDCYRNNDLTALTMSGAKGLTGVSVCPDNCRLPESDQFNLRVDSRLLLPKNDIKRLEMALTEALKVSMNNRVAAETREKELVIKITERKEQLNQICRANGWKNVISVTVCPQNRFDESSFWSRVIGLSPDGNWACKSRNTEILYALCKYPKHDVCAVVKGLKEPVTPNGCSSEYLEYVGVTKSRDEKGFDDKAPVWRVLPQEKFNQ